MPSSIDRRHFLAGTVASGLLAGFHRQLHAATNTNDEPVGPNDVIRVACIGVRGRGRNHLDGLEQVNGVTVVALCDIDESVLASEAARFEQRTGRKAKSA